MSHVGLFCLSALFMAASALSAAGAELKANVAAVDLTPPPAMKAALGGYGERMSRPATGVHDRIYAKALVISDGTNRFALVTADVLAFPPGVKSAVVAALASDGWKDAQIMLLASHSHASIDMAAINPKNTFHIPQIGLFSKDLFDLTVANLARAVSEASRNLTPITIGTNSTTLQGWNANRRAGNTIVDPELTVTRIDTTAGKPLVVLVNWTAHPTFTGPDDMMFSGEWPGQMQRTVEALVGQGVTAMYYNGAEGDQTKVARRGGDSSWEQLERYGEELGILVWREWEKIKPARSQTLAVHYESISLPPRTWHPEFMQTGGAEYGLNESNVRQVIETLAPTDTHSIALRLGDLLIVGVPGEMAAGLGLSVKDQVRRATGVRHVVIGGLADEWISYILSTQEYIKGGGYEASMSFYGPTLGDTLVSAVVRGAATLR